MDPKNLKFAWETEDSEKSVSLLIVKVYSTYTIHMYTLTVTVVRTKPQSNSNQTTPPLYKKGWECVL